MRLAICTPLYGGPDYGKYSGQYLHTLVRLARDPTVEALARVNVDTDLVRARSRAVRMFLELPDEFTHLLWWDEDVTADDDRIVACLRGMIASGHDMVFVPYPRKRLHWAAAEEAARAGRSAEGYAVDFPHVVDGAAVDGFTSVHVVNGCAEVARCHLGFTLCSRTMLRAMVDTYWGSLSFGDVIDGRMVPTVALFQLIGPGDGGQELRPLLSEDYSFCDRWRRMGGKTYAWLGEGAPLDHVGPYIYRGMRDGLLRPMAASTMPAPPDDVPQEGSIDYEATGEGGRLP